MVELLRLRVPDVPSLRLLVVLGSRRARIHIALAIGIRWRGLSHLRNRCRSIRSGILRLTPSKQDNPDRDKSNENNTANYTTNDGASRCALLWRCGFVGSGIGGFGANKHDSPKTSIIPIIQRGKYICATGSTNWRLATIQV